MLSAVLFTQCIQCGGGRHRDEDRARLIFYHDDRKLGLHKKKCMCHHHHNYPFLYYDGQLARRKIEESLELSTSTHIFSLRVADPLLDQVRHYYQKMFATRTRFSLFAAAVEFLFSSTFAGAWKHHCECHSGFGNYSERF